MPALELLYAGHFVQLPSEALKKKFAAHASHEEDPGDVVQLPEGHAVHAVEFGAGAKVPFAHREQVAAFVTLEKDPALQTEQVVEFAYEPRGHEHDRPPPEPR